MALPRLRTHDEKHKLSHLEFICVEVSKCNPMRGAQSGHSGADIRSDFQLAPSGQLPGWQHCHWCSPSKACYLESPTLSIRVGCVAASTFEHHFVLTLRKWQGTWPLSSSADECSPIPAWCLLQTIATSRTSRKTVCVQTNKQTNKLTLTNIAIVPVWGGTFLIFWSDVAVNSDHYNPEPASRELPGLHDADTGSALAILNHIGGEIGDAQRWDPR